jgi:CBS domain-containing protein/Tfp pilus assembly protein PilZ
MEKIKTYMSAEVRTIDGTETIRAAARKMQEHAVGSLLILKNGKEVGIVTRTDMTHKVVAEGIDPETRPVESIMTSPLIFIDSEASIEEADALMNEKQVRHLVVTENGRVAGVVSVRDFIWYFTHDRNETPEKRGYIRLPFTALVKYLDSERREYNALTYDINGGGLFIQTNRPLPVGSQVSIELALPREGRTIRSKGMVAWLKTADRDVMRAEGEIVYVKRRRQKVVVHPGGMGVKFTSISEEDRIAVMEFVSTIMEKIAPA